MHFERVISFHQHIPAPITDADDERLDLELAGDFHGLKTSRIRFCAFSYSMGEPCGRSFQVIMYCIPSTSSFTRVRVAGLVVGKIYASRRARVEPYYEEFLRAVLVDVFRLESGRLTTHIKITS